MHTWAVKPGSQVVQIRSRIEVLAVVQMRIDHAPARHCRIAKSVVSDLLLSGSRGIG